MSFKLITEGRHFKSASATILRSREHKGCSLQSNPLFFPRSGDVGRNVGTHFAMETTFCCSALLYFVTFCIVSRKSASVMLYLRNMASVSCPVMHIATACATPERIRLRAAHRRRSPTGAERTTTSTGRLPQGPALEIPNSCLDFRLRLTSYGWTSVFARRGQRSTSSTAPAMSCEAAIAVASPRVR